MRFTSIDRHAGMMIGEIGAQVATFSEFEQAKFAHSGNVSWCIQVFGSHTKDFKPTVEASGNLSTPSTRE
jgi:hypothetical protein